MVPIRRVRSQVQAHVLPLDLENLRTRLSPPTSRNLPTPLASYMQKSRVRGGYEDTLTRLNVILKEKGIMKEIKPSCNAYEFEKNVSASEGHYTRNLCRFTFFEMGKPDSAVSHVSRKLETATYHQCFRDAFTTRKILFSTHCLKVDLNCLVLFKIASFTSFNERTKKNRSLSPEYLQFCGVSFIS